ncbi:MAG: hypothetical protein WC796_04575 [Candidatus Pacearchaeota archaeon]|jgi:hypothetical protein
MARKNIVIGIICILAFAMLTLNLVKASSDLSLLSKNHDSCTEMWSCGTWGDCIHGERERSCRDLHHCGTIDNKPEVIKFCSCYRDDCYRYDHYNDCNDERDCNTHHYYGYFEDKYLEMFYEQQGQLSQPQQQTQPQETVKIYQIMPSDSSTSSSITTTQPSTQITGYSSYSLGSLSGPWTLILIILGILSIVLLIVIIVIVAVRR